VTGFALNELAAKLVAEQPKEAYRGKEYENLTMNLKFFECLLKKLLFETENAEFIIDEYFNDQKARVQMASEQRIQEIHRCQDILMAQLKEQKQKCLNTYSNMESFKQKTKEFISEMNAFIRQQRDYMKQLQINDNELMTANDVLLKLQKEVDMKRLSVKKLIFNNELCNFLSDEPPVIDELLGSFTRESLDSSKKTLLIGTEDGTIEHWDLASGECTKSFEGHKDSVKCIKRLSETRIVSCSADKSIKIWSLVTGRCIQTLHGHADQVCYVEMLPNNRLVSYCMKRCIRVWCLETGACLKELKDVPDDKHQVYGDIKVLPNDQLLTCSGKTIKLWDLSSGECLKAFEGHTSSTYCVDALSDGRIISASLDFTVRIWNLTKGKCLQTLKGHTNEINCMLVMPHTSSRLVTGSDDKTIKVWDLDSCVCIQTLAGHVDSVSGLCAVSDEYVASYDDDGVTKVWDIKSGDCVKTLTLDAYSILSI